MSKNSKSKRFILLVLSLLIIATALVSIFNYNKKTDTTLDNSTEASIEDTDNISSEVVSNDSTEENRFENIKVTNEDIGVPILYYHSVLPDAEVATPNEVTISPEKLREELMLVKELGYTTLTMSEFTAYINDNKPIPEKSILITFDDGYTDNYAHAFPILKELNMKATIFMIASQVDSGYYMSAAQLREMSDYGIDIESHTDNHVYLDTLSYDQQLKELKDSKEKIEKILGKEVTSIAYPYGNYNEDTKKAAIAAGFTFGFTTNKGLAKRINNKVELNRIYESSNYSLDIFKERL